MLHVVLLILKIIGIIIAVLLGLVILAVAAVFFVPIRYTAKAQYKDGIPVIQAKVTWLFHLLRIKCLFNLEEGLNIRIKILFFNLKSSKKDSNDEQDIEKKDIKKRHKKKEHSVFDEEEHPFHDEDIFFDKPEESIDIAAMEDIGVHKNQVMDSYKKTSSVEINEENVEHEQHLFETGVFEEDVKEHEKIKKNIFLIIKNKIIDIIQKIIALIQKVKVTKEKLTKKSKEISDMINDPKNREMVAFLWIQVKKLLKILKPKKVEAYIHFGLKDAETTGKAAMYAASLYGFIGKYITIYPDFEQEIIEGNIYIKGSIQLFPIGIIALKIYRNKQVRKYINKIKN